MATIFLSPARHHKPYLQKNCSEAIHCLSIATALQALLEKRWSHRSDQRQYRETLSAYRKSNRSHCDLYLALHTNAGGGRRCSFYHAGTEKGMDLSPALVQAIHLVYPGSVRPGLGFSAKPRTASRWAHRTFDPHRTL